jgi:hypothetical protein
MKFPMNANAVTNVKLLRYNNEFLHCFVDRTWAWICRIARMSGGTLTSTARERTAGSAPEKTAGLYSVFYIPVLSYH